MDWGMGKAIDTLFKVCKFLIVVVVLIVIIVFFAGEVRRFNRGSYIKQTCR